MRAGLSRDDLGGMSGVSGKQIGMIERGDATRSYPETLAGITSALSNVLNEDLDQFDIFPIGRRRARRKP